MLSRELLLHGRCLLGNLLAGREARAAGLLHLLLLAELLLHLLLLHLLLLLLLHHLDLLVGAALVQLMSRPVFKQKD